MLHLDMLHLYMLHLDMLHLDMLHLDMLHLDTLHINMLHGIAAQTSGHSFGNSITLSSAGDFVGIDLGDNYPRGINMCARASVRAHGARARVFLALRSRPCVSGCACMRAQCVYAFPRDVW